ncbi:MAG: arylesterase [Beijerinckiaceae bacterium]
MPSKTARETAVLHPMPRSRPGGYGHRRAFLQLSAALLLGVLLSPAWSAAKETAYLKIIAFGDSLVAGFGLAAGAAFPAVLEKTLRAEGFAVSVVNAGVSGDTASGGQARLDWALTEGADGVILELGANDMLRGIDPEVTRTALDGILGKLKARNIKVLIAGMKAAPNLGQDYKTRFDAIYPALAKKYDVPLYPFFLEGVAGDPALKLGDGLHPNPAGVERIVKGMLPAVRAFVLQFGARAARRD